jgi:hypothetical protein
MTIQGGERGAGVGLVFPGGIEIRFRRIILVRRNLGQTWGRASLILRLANAQGFRVTDNTEISRPDR